jgi:hypothetical protein
MIAEIRTRHFRPGHIDIFEVHPDYKADCERALPELELLGKICQAASNVIDGRIVYIFAYVFRNPNVLEVWLYPSIYLPSYRLSVSKHIKLWLKCLQHDFKVNRIQTWGDGSELSNRWLTFLGFKQEGVLESFLPDGRPLVAWGIVFK